MNSRIRTWTALVIVAGLLVGLSASSASANSNPAISSVTNVVNQGGSGIIISGSGFGNSFPASDLSVSTTTPYLEISYGGSLSPFTLPWTAGYSNAFGSCNVTVAAWSDTSIILKLDGVGGLSVLCPLYTGATLNVQVWNPATSAASNVATALVVGQGTLASVTTVTPGSGPLSGGTFNSPGTGSVTVVGTGLSTASIVWFGNEAATPVSVSANSLTVTPPASSLAEGVSVEVTTANGTTAANCLVIQLGCPDAYFYMASAPFNVTTPPVNANFNESFSTGAFSIAKAACPGWDGDSSNVSVSFGASLAGGPVTLSGSIDTSSNSGEPSAMRVPATVTVSAPVSFDVTITGAVSGCVAVPIPGVPALPGGAGGLYVTVGGNLSSTVGVEVTLNQGSWSFVGGYVPGQLAGIQLGNQDCFDSSGPAKCIDVQPIASLSGTLDLSPIWFQAGIGGAGSPGLSVGAGFTVAATAGVDTHGSYFSECAAATWSAQVDIPDLVSWQAGGTFYGPFQISGDGSHCPFGPTPSPPQFVSAPTTTFSVGVPGTFEVQATGSPPSAISSSEVSGQTGLPNWVSLTNNSDGTARLTGTPPSGSQGIYTFTLVASNNQGSVTQDFALDVGGSSTIPVITSANTTTFSVGTAGTFEIQATGSPTPTFAPGQIPPPTWLSLTDHGNGTATLSGTPPNGSAGTHVFSIVASNSLGSATQAFTLVVGTVVTPISSMSLTSSANPSEVGAPVAYTATLTPVPDAGTVSFADGASQISNCQGMAINSSGVAACTVTYSSPGSHSIVANYSGDTLFSAATSSTLKEQIHTPALFITTNTLPSGQIYSPYSATIGITGGKGPYTFSSSGTTPPGLDFYSGATLSGTPSQGGVYSFRVTVQDSSNPVQSVTQTITVTIQPVSALTITTPTLPNGVQGQPYSATVAATGGVPPYTFSATSLPSGLNIDPATGEISGTPTNSGAFLEFTVDVTDTVSGLSAQGYTISITNPQAASNVALVTQLPPGTGQLTGIKCLPDGVQSDCWAVGPGQSFAGLILHSTNGGSTWAKEAVPSGVNSGQTWAVDCPVLNICYVGTAGSLLKTIDGTNWSILPEPSQPTGQESISCPSVTECFVTAANAGVSNQEIMMTVDGGSTWTVIHTCAACSNSIPATTSHPFYEAGISCPTTQVCYAVGTVPNVGGAVLVTRDGGSTWTLDDSSFGQPFYDATAINCPGTNQCWLWTNAMTGAFSYPVTFSTSNGSNWAVSATPKTAIQNWTFGGISCINASECMIADGQAGQAYGTATGGPWSTYSLPQGLTGWLVNTDCVPSGQCWVVTQNGAILTTWLTNSTPVITSPDSYTPPAVSDVSRASFTFRVTTSGFPTAQITAVGLPAGLNLTDNGDGTATLSGSSVPAGDYAFTIDASNSQGSVAQTFGLTVNQSPTITSADYDVVPLNSPVSFGVTASGSPIPSISATTDSGQTGLPTGVSLNDNGNGTATLSGTPTQPGIYTCTIEASSAGSLTDQNFTLTVNGFGIVTRSLPPGETLAPYPTTDLAAAGGNPPYKWSLSSSKLPKGLHLSSAGVITGIPKASGTTTFTVKVADQKTTTKPYTQNTSTHALSITVTQPIPTITLVHPNTGPITGGTKVTITGTALWAPSLVMFGVYPAMGVTVNAAGTKITAYSPAESAGTVDIVVTTPGGASIPGSVDRFTYP